MKTAAARGAVVALAFALALVPGGSDASTTAAAGGGWADWNPAFSRTSDLVSWAPARELLRGVTGQRPYIKFDSYGSSIRFVYTGAHPDSRKTSLYFAELDGKYVRAAGGHRIASRSRLPFDYR